MNLSEKILQSVYIWVFYKGGMSLQLVLFPISGDT